MTLMPVSNIWRFDGSRAVEVGGRAVDVPALDVVEVGVVGVERFAPHVPHVAEHLVADRHADAAAGVAHRRCRG